MKLTFIFILNLLTLEAMALTPAGLSREIIRLETLYSQVGVDNNDLESLMIQNTTAFGALRGIAHGEIRPLRMHSDFELHQTLNKCVFMSQGAYGRHLDSKSQYGLSVHFMKFLTAGRPQIDLFVVKDIGLGTIHNNCALMAYFPLEKSAFILQGVSGS